MFLSTQEYNAPTNTKRAINLPLHAGRLWRWTAHLAMVISLLALCAVDAAPVADPNPEPQPFIQSGNIDFQVFVSLKKKQIAE